MHYEVVPVVVEVLRELRRPGRHRDRLLDDRLEPDEGERHRRPEGGECDDTVPQIAATREQPGAGAGDARGRLQHLALVDLGALGHRRQRLRHLGEGIQRRVELRRLPGHRLQHPRVLDRDAGHRAELGERLAVALREGRRPGTAGPAPERACRAGHGAGITCGPFTCTLDRGN